MSKQRWLWVMTAMGLLVAGGLQGDTYHTPLKKTLPGGIVGVVSPADGLQTVIAFEPYETKAYQAEVDSKTGRFTFRGLPPGEYDLLIKSVGRVYEGLTLEFKPGQKLNRKQLQTLSDEVTKTYFKMEDFFNVKRIVRLTGLGERARMLVVQTRTLQVVEPSAKQIQAHIRRFDCVELRKTRKVWQIVRNRHLLRQEVPHKSKDIKLEPIYSPKLGKILVGQRVKDLGTIHLKKLPVPKVKRYASAEYKHEKA